MVPSATTHPLPAVWTSASPTPAAAAAAAEHLPQSSPAVAGSAAATAGKVFSPRSSTALPAPSQAAVWPCAVSLLLADPERRPLQSPRGGAVNAAGRGGRLPEQGPLHATGSSRSGASPPLSMAEPCGRRWTALPAAGHGAPPLQVAYSLQRAEGVHHLVIFHDHQPPLRLVNSTGQRLPPSCLLPSLPHCKHRCTQVRGPQGPRMISWRAAAARHCSRARGTARCTSITSRHAGEPLEVGTAAPLRCAASSKRSSFVYDDGSPAAVHLLAPRQTLDCAPAAAARAGDASEDDEGAVWPEGAHTLHLDRQLFRSAAQASFISSIFFSQVPFCQGRLIPSRLTLFAASATSEQGISQFAEQFAHFMSSNALAVLVRGRHQGLGVERQLTALCWRGQARRSRRRRRASWRASPPAPPRPWGRRPPCCCCGLRAAPPGRAPACWFPDAVSPVLPVALAMPSPQDNRIKAWPASCATYTHLCCPPMSGRGQRGGSSASGN